MNRDYAEIEFECRKLFGQNEKIIQIILKPIMCNGSQSRCTKPRFPKRIIIIMISYRETVKNN